MYHGAFERFFLLGIKRVIKSSPKYSKFDLMKRNYPYIDEKGFPPLKKEILFFYEEELKEEIVHTYLKPNRHIERSSPDFHRIIGTILGYPPKAVEFFSSGDHERFPEKTITLSFCGVDCIGSIDDMVEDVQWLWEKYPYPEKDILMVARGRDFVDIPYGDLERAKELQQTAKAYLEKQKAAQ